MTIKLIYIALAAVVSFCVGVKTFQAQKLQPRTDRRFLYALCIGMTVLVGFAAAGLWIFPKDGAQ